MKSSARSSGADPSPLARRALKAFSYLAEPGRTFGVAVSGGSDSMALLMLAADYRDSVGIPFIAFTVDHGLRPEAKAEVRFVRHACDALGVKHHALLWKRDDDGPASQAAARQARHRLIAESARRLGVDRVALGHTQDDRLETFLMRARQGSGWHGLAGPMPNSVSPVLTNGGHLRLMRPLIAFSREELREELRSRGVGWVEDPSNEADRFERVRIRRVLGRMEGGARAKAVKVMNGLMRLRAAVVAEAGSCLADVWESGGRAGIGLEGVGGEGWRRFVEAMVMAAGGAGGGYPPRRDALDRLLARIEARDPQLARGVTLAGAMIRLRKDGVLTFDRAPPRRGQPPHGPGDKPDWSRAKALLEVPDLRVLEV